MRFLTLVAAFAGASSALSAVPCLKLANAIRNFDATTMANSLLARGCEANLDLKLTDYPVERDAYIAPLADQVTQAVGGSRHKDLYMFGIDQLYQLAMEKCSSKLPKSQIFCENKDMTKDFANCVKSNVWTIAVNNVSKLKALLEEPLCQGHVDLLKSGKFEQAAFAQLERYIQDHQKQ